MKNILPRSTFYFSAYPLKALNLSDAEKKSYLHIYSKSDKSTKRSLHSKILPMVNPYLEVKKEKIVEVKNKLNDRIEEMDSDWFANYE
jgi:hypothetical protein